MIFFLSSACVGIVSGNNLAIDAGGLRFVSQEGQTRRTVVNNPALLQCFFQSCVS